MPFVVFIVIVILLIVLAVQYWYVALPVLMIVIGIVVTPKIVRRIKKDKYFSSEEFLTLRAELAAVVSEHNSIVEYTSEIRSSGAFDIGASSTGAHSHLSSFENTSRQNYRRDRNVPNFQSSHIHNCSLQIVKNAWGQPIKYFMKYFNVKPTEENLAEVERLGDDIARLEAAIDNLRVREEGITTSINPPAFILKHFADEFNEHVGVELSPVAVPYPKYAFEYVSAGGNSSQRAPITLDSQTIDELIELLSEKIKFQKSAAGQRALMTARLRAWIKDRDHHTCRFCGVSLEAEPHLLLEVDHIQPVSKGGLTTVENLQTLCWKCNRSKSNKVL